MPIIAQRNWRWCSKCQGLWYSAATANPNGICAAGGGHSRASSGEYALYCDPDGSSTSTTLTAQHQWRWCSRCQGLWYSAAKANPNGVCPAGGSHTRGGSGDYALING